MPATHTLGTTTLTLLPAPTTSITPTSMVAPVPILSILQSVITTTPLTTSLPATSTLGTAKHTLNPELIPTTTHNQVLPATTLTLYI